MQIHLFAFLIFLQTLVSCQNTQDESLLSATANASFSSNAAPEKAAEKTPETASSLVFKTENGGLTWQDISAGLPAATEAWNIYADAGQVFLGTEKGLFSRSEKSKSALWQKEFLAEDRIFSIQKGQAGPIARTEYEGLFQKLTGTNVWISVFKSLGDVHAYEVLEMKNGSVLAACQDGLYKSADGGKTWKHVFKTQVWDVFETEKGIFCGGAKGVSRSTDGGETWKNVLFENEISKKTGQIGDRIFSMFGSDDVGKVHPEGITFRLRVSEDGGETWSRIDAAPFPLVDVNNMDATLAEIRDLYDMVAVGDDLICSFDTGLFRSSDRGKTWTMVLPTSGNSRFEISVSGNSLFVIKTAKGC